MQKTLTLLFIFIVLFSFNSFGQLLFEENFDYPAGDSLTSHTWVAHSGGTTNAQTIISPGLTYTDYPSSGIGNAASLTTTGQDVNRQFADSVTAGTVYASLMVNVTSAQTAGDYFFHLGPKTLSTIFMGRVFVKLAANGNLAFGLSKTTISASILPVYSDSIYTIGTTYLLVLKYQFNAGVNDDTVSLFINPIISASEPTPDLQHGTSSSNDPASLGTVALRQGTASNAAILIIDGIRISNFWNDILPVELVSFNANFVDGAVLLSWKTATETNNLGFAVEKSLDGQSFTDIGFVNGSGTTTEAKSYSFVDSDLGTAANLYYRLRQIDYDGQAVYTTVIQVEVVKSISFNLAQNYPNPFNPATTIGYVLQEKSHAKLTVLNALGEEIAVLVNQDQDKGYYTVQFDGSNLSSGVYFYKLIANNFVSTKKMILVK
jgi:hypothetical protein